MHIALRELQFNIAPVQCFLHTVDLHKLTVKAFIQLMQQPELPVEVFIVRRKSFLDAYA